MKKSFFGLVTGFLLFGFSGLANAQLSETPSEPSWSVSVTLPVDYLIHIDNGGVIREVATGSIRTPAEVEDRLKLGPVALGILIGAGGGALGAVIGRASWGQVVSAGILGGVAGYYGAVASIASGTGRLLYGTYSAVYGGAGTTLVGTAPANSGDCVTVSDSHNCLIKAP